MDRIFWFAALAANQGKSSTVSPGPAGKTSTMSPERGGEHGALMLVMAKEQIHPLELPLHTGERKCPWDSPFGEFTVFFYLVCSV